MAGFRQYVAVLMWHSIAQPSQLHTYEEITAPTLRAPEIILHGPWDEKVDIWAFGCLVRFPFPIIPLTEQPSDIRVYYR